jgi:hypothetical protein
MSDAARVLEAGGLVTPGSELPSDLPVDTVDARGYRHPALPDRVVVRLVADVIARGVDTEMGLLGFALAEHHDDIALRRRQALGFPGRALLEDPDRARFALDVMKEFKAQAKRIASKPGHAREGFEEIAQKLERTVPQFLPSYWEEVGRAFATAGNLAYAASSFDKARTAEREFGLTVDEGIRGDAFLEFALLGALTVKSLQTYGKELQKTVGAEAAHDRMVSLAVRRTLGGPPPWASMLKDLRGLAKAAKRDVDAEECRLVRELLAGSSMVRAPKSFWQESKASLAHLAAHEPLVRARLLDLFPNGGATRYSWRRDDGFTDEWMELLAEIGVLDVIWDPNTPKDALPAGGRAAWLGRLLEWAPAGNSWILQVVRRSADVLRADGDRVPVHAERAYRPFDLDLLELVIELALPYSTGDGALRVDLDEWAQWQSAPERHGLAAEVRPKDPIRAVAVPALARRLSSAIDAAFGETHFEEVAARMSALRTLRGAWLAERVADLTRSGLGLTASALERLEGVSSASHFAEFPECFEALKAADVARSLHRTLQTGILDELGWDAFDASVDALNPKPDDDEVIQTSQWPHLIWGLAHRLYVLGPSGVELVHDVKLGKDVAPTCVAWVGGELFVGASSWSRGSYQQQAYWSGAAADVFEVEGLSHSRDSSPIEDGDAIVMGAERFTRRDRVAVPDAAFQFHDHERSWVWHEYALHEQDRRTGKPGAKGAPGFLADALHDGPASWSYRVVPEPYAATSPLGTVNGLYGAKVVTPAPVDEDPTLDEDTLDDENETSSETRVETLAGARFVGPIHEGTSQHQPTRLMRWPGTSAWRPIVPERYRWRRHHDHSFRIGDPDLPVVSIVQDDDVRMAARLLPPIEFWHYLRPRDEAGSLALRAVTTDVARALLDAGEDEGAGLPAAIAAGLPSVTNDALRAGVGLVSKLAYELEQRLLTLQEERAGGKVGERSESEIQDSAVTDALDNLRHYWSWGGSYVSAEIRTLGAFLARGEDVEIRESRLEPRDWIGRIRGIAACAVRPGVEDAPRAALIEALRVWRDSGLADPGSFRIGRMRLDALQPWVVTETDDGVTSPVEEFKVELDGRRLWVWDCDTDDEGPWDFDFVEWSADGTFGGLPGAVVSRERTARIDGDREWLDDFFTEVAARGPREVTPEAVAAVAEAIGQSPAEAVVALCTFPKELPKAIREAHGLKATAAKGAASAFGDWSADRKLDLLVAMSPRASRGSVGQRSDRAGRLDRALDPGLAGAGRQGGPDRPRAARGGRQGAARPGWRRAPPIARRVRELDRASSRRPLGGGRGRRHRGSTGRSAGRLPARSRRAALHAHPLGGLPPAGRRPAPREPRPRLEPGLRARPGRLAAGRDRQLVPRRGEEQGAQGR